MGNTVIPALTAHAGLKLDALCCGKKAGADLALVPVFLAEEGVRSGEAAYVLADRSLGPIDIFAVWPSNAPKDGLVRLFIGELSKDKFGE